ncbi:uncharacterized protein RCC_07749 [Ramularia collo-cygni]|uniref:Uncharacterized protein n=1 Tax=Ramularia collo-cygni TaxID=112498 RepID=A0A2D3VL41_9PEZI|nr:uncharacterized protein RCC_07749 [Ramularia collo-cygni]CZT21883.1 uncharacterized protein RCC_07749 [Ramularia collo-cygni]
MSHAAAKVFDIPELFEMILIEVTLQAIADEDSKKFNPGLWEEWESRRHREMEPITSLSRLKVVNRTFSNCIRQSSKIQRAMFSGPISTSIDCNKGGLVRPLRWFNTNVLGTYDTGRSPGYLSKFGYEDSNVIKNGINTVKRTKDYESTPLHRLALFRQTKAKHPQASWRRVNLGVDAIQDRVMRMFIKFRRPRGFGENQNTYVEDWVFNANSTLGDVFDHFTEVVDRTSVGHGRRALLFNK